MILIGLLSVFSFAILGIFGMQAVFVSAETPAEEVSVEETVKEKVSADTITWLTESFVMDFGASVRIGDTVTDENGNVTYENYGIRFSVTAKTTAAQTAFANLVNSDAVTGVLIAPAASLKNAMATNGISDKNAALTAQTVFGDSWYDFATAGTAWTDTTIYNLVSTIKNNTLYGAIINLNTTNFLQKYTGVAYVGVPATYNEDGSVATYTYYFAKYAEGNNPITGEIENDVFHNTRCMYYVAQRAIENGAEEASVLKASYIDTFATAYPSVFNNTQFKYTTVHHYYDLDGNEANTWTVTAGATLAEYDVSVAQEHVLQAEVMEGTYDYGTTDPSDDLVFVKDETTTGLLDRSYLYAGGMTYLHVYYTTTTLHEQNKAKTNQFFSDISAVEGYEDTYFGGSMTISSNSDGDKELDSIDDKNIFGIALGQNQLEFTDDFINKAATAGFTKLYIEKAELFIGGITSLADSIFSGGNVRVDTLKVMVGETLIATLNANVVGYTIQIEETGIIVKRENVTITFSGITIDLPTTIEETEALSISAWIAGANEDGSDKQLSGEWTLTGLMFG